MYKKEQECYGKLGKDYWWIKGKYEIIIDCMRRTLGGKHSVILDVGCGSGNMFDLLKEFGEVHGMDVSEEAILLSRNKGYRSLTQASIEHTPYQDASFDSIVALDILEHVPDDTIAIQEIYRILKPEGYLFFSIPAYNFLWGKHDELYYHFRRYTRKEIKRKLKENGMQIVKISYIEPLFVIPVFILRNIKRAIKSERDDFVVIPAPINALLRKMISFEKYILRFFTIPFGVSIVGIAKKACEKRFS